VARVPRRTAFRCIAGAAAFALLLAGFAAPSAQATVAPTSLVTVDGFLTTVSSSNPDLLVVNYTVTVQGDPLTDAQLTTKTFPSAPVDPGTVQVDGAAPPSPAISQSAKSMTVRIGTGADATNGGSLGVGSYLVSYQQQRPSGGSSNAATSATLAFDRAGTPATVTSGPVALTHPDLSLTIPAKSGEDKAAYLGTGRIAGFGAYLKNRGASTDAATLTLTLPDGLRLDTVDGVERISVGRDDAEFGSSLRCTNALTATVTCALGAVLHGTESVLLIPVVATHLAKPGTRGTFHVAVAADGEPDQDASNNALSGRVKFTGIAHLEFSMATKHTTVQVGKTANVRLRIHNQGPEPASMTFGITMTDSAHFAITKLTTKRHPKSGPSSILLPIPAKFGSALAWNVGYIPSGHMAYAELTLKAKSVGTSVLEFEGASTAADPPCDAGSKSCAAQTSLKLHAVKKAAVRKAAAKPAVVKPV
jgi:hypothetical protein